MGRPNSWDPRVVNGGQRAQLLMAGCLCMCALLARVYTLIICVCVRGLHALGTRYRNCRSSVLDRRPGELLYGDVAITVYIYLPEQIVQVVLQATIAAIATRNEPPGERRARHNPRCTKGASHERDSDGRMAQPPTTTRYHHHRRHNSSWYSQHSACTTLPQTPNKEFQQGAPYERENPAVQPLKSGGRCDGEPRPLAACDIVERAAVRHAA